MDSSDQQQQQAQQQYQYQYQQPNQEAAGAAAAAAAVAAYDPSQTQPQPQPHPYDPYYAAYHNQQYPYYDYSQAYPHADPAAAPGPAAAAAGMNPAAAAAVAALSQVSEFAASMDAAERGMPHFHQQYLQQQQHYPTEFGSVSIQPGGVSGGGRRGGTPFRGGGRRGRGPFRGGRVGRGRGRGRRQHQYEPAPYSQPTQAATAPPGEQSSAPGGEMQQAPAVHARGRVAWCDICRVDCNSWDILEQHKNGKKHKKTLLRLAEFERQQKLYPELQAQPTPVAMLPNAVTDKAAEVVSVAPENIMIAAASTVVESEVTHTPSVVPVDDTSKTFNPEESKPVQQGLELEVQAAGQEQVTEASRGPLRSDGHSQFDTRRGGMKRKSNKSGRGGKRLKSFEPARARPPLRQKDRPRFCTICNVLCESLVVFDAHVAGKKHLSKLKRFQGQGTVFGPITIYIPPNQPSPYPKQGPEPLYFGLTSQEMLQHESYMGLNGFQAESYGFHQGEVNPDNGNNEAVLRDNPENQATAAADAPLVFESKEPPQLPIEPEVANSEADALSRAEFGTLPEDDPALTGLDAKMEQPGADS